MFSAISWLAEASGVLAAWSVGSTVGEDSVLDAGLQAHSKKHIIAAINRIPVFLKVIKRNTYTLTSGNIVWYYQTRQYYIIYFSFIRKDSDIYTKGVRLFLLKVIGILYGNLIRLAGHAGVHPQRIGLGGGIFGHVFNDIRDCFL